MLSLLSVFLDICQIDKGFWPFLFFLAHLFSFSFFLFGAFFSLLRFVLVFLTVSLQQMWRRTNEKKGAKPENQRWETAEREREQKEVACRLVSKNAFITFSKIRMGDSVFGWDAVQNECFLPNLLKVAARFSGAAKNACHLSSHSVGSVYLPRAVSLLSVYACVRHLPCAYIHRIPIWCLVLFWVPSAWYITKISNSELVTVMVASAAHSIVAFCRIQNSIPEQGLRCFCNTHTCIHFTFKMILSFYPERCGTLFRDWRQDARTVFCIRMKLFSWLNILYKYILSQADEALCVTQCISSHQLSIHRLKCSFNYFINFTPNTSHTGRFHQIKITCKSMENCG